MVVCLPNQGSETGGLFLERERGMRFGYWDLGVGVGVGVGMTGQDK